MDLAVDRDSGVPVGTQLAWRLRGLIAEGGLAPGQRLPSIRELAVRAGVNINTVRAVYARLEREGVVRTEHGRGTFVAAPAQPGRGERGRLRRQIAALERELSTRPPLPAEPTRSPRPGGALLTTDELASVRDDLMDRLRALDVARAEVIESLQALTAAERVELAELAAEEAEPERQSSTSLSGARVRWVGA